MGSRVMIENLNRYTTAKQVKKLLNDREIKFRKFNLVPGQTHASFIVESIDLQQESIKLLEGTKIKGNQLIFKPGKQIAIEEAEKKEVESVEIDDVIITEDDMLRITAPLYQMPYEEQLQLKHAKAIKLYEEICASICKLSVDRIPKDCTFYGTFMPMVPSPVIHGYRNKCEFTCGYTPQGVKTAGFQAGPFKRGHNFVFPATNCLNVSDQMKTVASQFGESILQKTDLSILNLDTNSGFWKILTIRQFCFDMMVIVTVDPKGIGPDVVETVKKDLIDFFMRQLEGKVGVTSLYLATQTTNSSTPEMHHLACAPYVYERLMGLRFRVSPSSFFQPNSAAAGKLYETIASVANLNSNTILLDICCGTGTIGISLAKTVKFVVGIEMCKEAVEDAKKNAEDNQLQDKCRFICSPAENVSRNLPSYLPAKSENDEIVGILDPPRAGLHDCVIVSVRNLSQLKRLIYVSCDPKAAQKNMIDLCRIMSNKFSGIPFKIESVIPVDMLPHTNMTEWVVIMKRIF